MSSLCWLHLSDIHFRPSSEWSDATARDALLEHLRDTISKRGLAIDLIFCTGDIAFGELRGQPLAGQYALAQRFFNELRQVCGNLPAERVFVVPGNHDVNRNAVDPHAQAHWHTLASDASSHASRINQEFAANSGSANFALKRIAEYGDFVRAAFPHQQAPTGHHHYAQVVNIRGCKVGIGGFNSAWTCAGPEDDRNLWLAAEAQFNHMRTALAPANLRIGLIHHPTDCFNLADRQTIEARSKADFDFWLHGHTHDLGLLPHAEGIRICAGATAADSAAESGYTIVRFDTASGQGNALLFDYDKSGRARWKPFTIASVAEHGEQTFTLHRLVPKTPPTAAITHPIATQQTPPPAANPPLFSRPLPPAGPCLERETELARLAEFTSATPPRPVLIHGYGGLGKTEIASACLHSHAARACFGARRLFVSVEALEGTAATDLPARLRQHLDFALFNGALSPTTSIADGLFAALQAGGPALLVLDNFETVVKIDAAHAADQLDQLAPLADAGLALVVTLREPLAQPRSRFASIAPQPFADPAARHLLCHWMDQPAGAALSPRDESALGRLLRVAEGWPIQLQMLGILAAIEGLPGLAKRCPDGAGLMQLTDDLPGRDAHRHPLLSNRLTYDAPSLGDAARSLLRVLAQFPAGLPDDWLEHWPDQTAVRTVQAHKLLATVPGALGEARLKLHTPLRDYLLHAQPLQGVDKALLHIAAHAWWQAQAPELFDDTLQQRPSAAAYRDLHRREVGSIAILRGLGAGPRDIFVRLEARVGDVDDWPQRCAALRAQVLSSAALFPSPEDAEHFAWLLAGSQSIPSAMKESIASLISEKLLPASNREGMQNVLASELDAWSWTFGST